MRLRSSSTSPATPLGRSRPAIFAAAVPATVGGHGDDSPTIPLAFVAALAAVAVVPLAWRLVAPAAAPLLLAAAFCSAGAAAIHFAVANEHFGEWWLFGVFFVCVGSAQLAWAVLALVRPRAWLLIAGALGNVAVVAVWIVTRTIGLPFGPDAGTADSFGLPDIAASILEGLVAVDSLAVLAATSLRMTGRRVAEAVIVLVAPAVVALTTAALVSHAR